MTTTAELLAHAAEAETNAAAQDAEAATARTVLAQETDALRRAHADRRRAHRKATRADRPNSHVTGRAELSHIDETVIPAIERRIADARAEVEHLEADAARLRALAADYRAQHTAATAAPVTVATPFAFIDWYADYGTDKTTDADADPALMAARTAARTAPAGERVKITTADPRILDGLITAAAAFTADTRSMIEHNPDDAGLLARDIRTAERFADRVREARTELLAQAQQAPAAPLADWERELLAAADTLPTADREPSSDLNIAQGDDPQGPQERPTAAYQGPAPVVARVEWTATVRGHHKGVLRFPNGATYKITHVQGARADRGAEGDHIAHPADGAQPEEGPAITWGLADLATVCAEHAGYTGPVTIEQTGRHLLAPSAQERHERAPRDLPADWQRAAARVND